MFYLIFGAIWTGIIALITIPMIFVETDFFATLFLIPFWLVGIYILKLGLQEVRRNKATNDFGEECYGVITDIYESGTYVNDVPELKADMKVFVPSMRQVISVSEKIGLAHKATEYDIGTYVLLKYYNGDVNLVYSIDEMIIPADAKLELGAVIPKAPVQDTIIVNGVEYVRKK